MPIPYEDGVLGDVLVDLVKEQTRAYLACTDMSHQIYEAVEEAVDRWAGRPLRKKLPTAQETLEHFRGSSGRQAGKAIAALEIAAKAEKEKEAEATE